MWVLLLVLKVASIAFIIGGTAAIIIRGVRRSRANRLAAMERSEQPTRLRGIRCWRNAQYTTPRMGLLG